MNSLHLLPAISFRCWRGRPPKPERQGRYRSRRRDTDIPAARFSRHQSDLKRLREADVSTQTGRSSNRRRPLGRHRRRNRYGRGYRLRS